MPESKRMAKLEDDARVLVRRLGHDVEDPAVVREVFEVLYGAFNAGLAKGQKAGHKAGWEDRGRDEKLARKK